MIKTQVQIPDELYRKAEQVAAERELSFAEVMRRGLEYVTRVYLEEPDPKVSLPVLDGSAFRDGIDEVDLRATPTTFSSNFTTFFETRP